MTLASRWTLAVLLVLADILMFSIPLTGFVAAYVLVVRPSWFRRWVDELYENR